MFRTSRPKFLQFKFEDLARCGRLFHLATRNKARGEMQFEQVLWEASQPRGKRQERVTRALVSILYDKVIGRPRASALACYVELALSVAT